MICCLLVTGCVLPVNLGLRCLLGCFKCVVLFGYLMCGLGVGFIVDVVFCLLFGLPNCV